MRIAPNPASNSAPSTASKPDAQVAAQTKSVDDVVKDCFVASALITPKAGKTHLEYHCTPKGSKLVLPLAIANSPTERRALMRDFIVRTGPEVVMDQLVRNEVMFETEALEFAQSDLSDEFLQAFYEGKPLERKETPAERRFLADVGNLRPIYIVGTNVAKPAPASLLEQLRGLLPGTTITAEIVEFQGEVIMPKIGNHTPEKYALETIEILSELGSSLT